MNKLEEKWHEGLIECLAEELWQGYKHWELETHNVGEVLWEELPQERKDIYLAIANQLVEERKGRGLELKKL